MLFNTHFTDLKLYTSGKVRDVYDFGDTLLIVATDRISAFDVVFETPIRDKGKILTKMSVFWFNFLKDDVKNHFITDDISKYPPECEKYRDLIIDRSMLVRKTTPIPIECIVRGYISGSAWNEYRKSGMVCGIKLKGGLRESEKLEEPIFTPTTKAKEGHDKNIDFDCVVKMIGGERAEMIRDISIKIYKKASKLAFSKGIIIADTKFEFGTYGGDILLIDEVLTPDSSRFWPFETYEPGKSQISFDKQFVRDYLLSINWDKKPPAPKLPEEILEKTRQRYWEAYNLLTK